MTQPAATSADDTREWDPVGSKLAALIWGLIWARWFLPAEGTVLGETLWLCMVTAITAAVWALQQSVSSPSGLLRGHWDRAVWALVIAHVAAATAVILTVGQKRAAMNMIWEWTAVGIQFLLLRQTLVSARQRGRFLMTGCVLGAALGAYGLAQHFVLFPLNVKYYDSLRSELTELEQSRPTSPAQIALRSQRLQEVKSTLIAEGVPLEGPQVGLFERRLRDSREPIAFFALTNSLSGILATCLLIAVVWCGLAPREKGASAKRRLTPAVVMLGLCALVTLICLLLTKSRTALCGTVAGAVVCAAIEWRRRRASGAEAEKGSPARGRIWIAAGTGFVLLLVAGLWKLGSLDRETLTEATKSLSYRWQYWTATVDVILESRWLGIGPGNFRWHYLRHRVPGASEEIADPHQLVLDVTANAGLLGLAALLGLALVVVHGVRCSRIALAAAESTEQRELAQTADRRSSNGVLSIVLAVAVVASWQLLYEGSPRMAVLVVGSGAALALLIAERVLSERLLSDERLHRTAVVAGLVAMCVHLSGAGGIAVPAILNWLLSLIAVLSLIGADSGKSCLPVAFRGPIFFRVAALNFLFVAFLMAKFGWGPVLLSQNLVAAGDQDLGVSGRLQDAMSRYQAAAGQDPLSPEPWRGLARVAFVRWQLEHDAALADSAFEEGVRYSREALARDPHNASISYEVGNWYRQKFDRTRRASDGEEAATWLESAVRAYPTNAVWLAHWSTVLSRISRTDDARTAARRALDLEALNRRAGHIDRYLPDDLAKQVREIAE